MAIISFLSTQHWWGHTCSTLPSSGFFSTRQTWHPGESPMYSHVDDEETQWSHMRKSWEIWDFSSKKRRTWKFFPEDINTWRKDGKRNQTLCSRDSSKDNGHEEKYRSLPECCHNQQWGCEVFIARHSKKSSGHHPGQLALGDTAWAGEVWPKWKVHFSLNHSVILRS